MWMLVAEGDVLFSLCEAEGSFEDSLSLPVYLEIADRRLGKCPVSLPLFPLSLPQPVPRTETLWYLDGRAFDREPRGQI